MVDDKEFEKLKKEHNKAVAWIEFFSHKLDEFEKEINSLKEELKEKSEKEDILARTVLKLVEEKNKE